MVKFCHAGDVHLRLFKRHQEYRQVFERFITSIKENNVDRVLLLGDLFHNKTNLSPEVVDLSFYLLSSIADFCRLDVIIGNHDCIVNQTNRLDSITPIVNRLNHKNITLYKDSGLYDTGDNIVYGIFAINNTEKYPIRVAEKDENKTYIALFHGAINSSSTDVGYRLKSENDISMFDDYDFVMMADIHKQQYLRYNKTDKMTPNAGYSGSLICQNHGEQLDKGYLFWEIENRDDYKVSPIVVENDYGYYTIRLNEETAEKVNELEFLGMPKKPYLRVVLDSDKYSASLVKTISHILKTRYNPVSISIETDIDAISREMSLDDLLIENVYDLAVQKKMLTKYFKLFKLSDKDIDKILDIHAELFNTRIDQDIKLNKGSSWHINNIEYSNTFSYGSDNYVDFNVVKGLVGIFSQNASGKSSFIDALLIGFFNMSSRASKNNIVDVINKNEDVAEITLQFSVDSRSYVIERNIARRKDDMNRALSNVNLYELRDGEQINLTGEKNVRGTEAFIRDLIGSFDEHKFSTFGLQSELTNFIGINQSNRKEVLCKFIGIDIIENLYQVAKEECTTLKNIVSQYKKYDYDSLLKNISKKIEEINADLKLISTKKVFTSSKLGNLVEIIGNLKSSIKSVEFNGLSRESILRNITDTKNRVNILKKESENTIGEIVKCAESNRDIVEQLSTFPSEDKLKVAVELFNVNKKKVEEQRRELELIKKDYKHYLKMSETLTAHEWFVTSEQCQKCNFLNNAFIAKDSLVELEEKSKVIYNSIKEVEKSIVDISPIEKLKEYERLISMLVAIDSKSEFKNLEFSKITDNVSHTELLLSNLRGSLENYNKNEEIIKFNERAKLEIVSYEKELKTIKRDLEEIEGEYSSKNVELGQLSQKLKDLQETIDGYKEVESNFTYYNYLKDALSKDGIQLSIIKKVIPKINLEIKKILSTLPNFDIMLEVENESQDISIFIEDNINKRRIELGSGMERTVAAIAIRAALTNISLLPKSNLFVIDEGFGALDTENLIYMNSILEQLKSMFETVIIISHVDSQQDVCDHIITIEKNEEGYSKLKIV